MKAKLREDRKVAIGPNDVWAMDFVQDQAHGGHYLRVPDQLAMHGALHKRLEQRPRDSRSTVAIHHRDSSFV